MAEQHRYTKQSDTLWVPEDNPDSPASRLARKPRTLHWTVARWATIHNVSGHDTTKEREPWTYYYDEPRGARLLCTLNDDRRRFHSLAEDGTAPINAPIEFRLIGIEEAEIEGLLSHRKEYTSEDGGEHFPEGLSATLGIPQERFEYFVGQLDQPGAKLRVSLAVPLFKKGIADAFDEDWMTQDFYLARGEDVKIEHYDLAVISGPDADKWPRILTDDDDDDDDNGGSSQPLPVEQMGGLTIAAPAPDRRLTYIVWLLAALVFVQLFRG